MARFCRQHRGFNQQTCGFSFGMLGGLYSSGTGFAQYLLVIQECNEGSQFSMRTSSTNDFLQWRDYSSPGMDITRGYHIKVDCLK